MLNFKKTIIKQINYSLCVSVCAFTLNGCATQTYQVDSESAAMSGEAQVATLDDRIRFFGKNISPLQEKALLADNIIYFDYDKYEVHDNDLLTIYAFAKYLLDHPEAKIRINGHTDRHGSANYNLALGERRARAVKNIMTFKGVDNNRIEVVSYGKEKLMNLNTDSDSDRLNRRAELMLEVLEG